MNKNSNLEAADLLFKECYLKEATILYWHTFRNQLFDCLKRNNIEYNSTKEALKEIILLHKDNKETIKDICFFETIATLSEWDPTFEINKNQVQFLRNILINSKLNLYKNA